MKLHIYHTTLLLIFLLLTGCYKDNNNYLQNDVNVMEIAFDKDTLAIQQYDTLSLSPTLKESIKSDDDYTYEWLVYNSSGTALSSESDENRLVISSEKELNTEIKLAPGNYVLQYRVKNSRTGVSGFHSLALTVNSSFYEGLVVAHNRNGIGDIDFIRQDGELIRNLFTDKNTAPMTSKVNSISIGIVRSQYESYVFSEDNMYRLDANSFLINGDVNNIFTDEDVDYKQATFQANFDVYENMPIGVYLMTGGKIYTDLSSIPEYGQAPAGRFSTQLTYSTDYDVYPFVFNDGDDNTVFYDNKGKRFISLYYIDRELMDYPNKGGAFDVSNVGKTAVSVIEGYAKDVYYLMKDDAGFYVYTMTQHASTPAKDYQQVDLSKAKDMDKASSYTASALNSAIYYAVGNKLYLYNISTNSSTVIYQLPAGNISDIEILRKRFWEQNGTNPQYNKRIMVAADNGGNGEVYYFDLDNSGKITGDYVAKYTGFGEIADIEYRNPN